MNQISRCDVSEMADHRGCHAVRDKILPANVESFFLTMTPLFRLTFSQSNGVNAY
jgi:hypothetical protein